MAHDSDTVSLRITLRYRDLDEFVHRYADNLSAAGLFLRTKAPKPTGTKIRFELLLSSGTRALRGEGVVVATRSDEKPGMALRFNLLDSDSQALIDRVVAEKGNGSLAPTPLTGDIGKPTDRTAAKPTWRATRTTAPSWTSVRPVGSTPQTPASTSPTASRLPRRRGSRVGSAATKRTTDRPWAGTGPVTPTEDLEAHRPTNGESQATSDIASILESPPVAPTDRPAGAPAPAPGASHGPPTPKPSAPVIQAQSTTVPTAQTTAGPGVETLGSAPQSSEPAAPTQAPDVEPSATREASTLSDGALISEAAPKPVLSKRASDATEPNLPIPGAAVPPETPAVESSAQATEAMTSTEVPVSPPTAPTSPKVATPKPTLASPQAKVPQPLVSPPVPHGPEAKMPEAITSSPGLPAPTPRPRLPQAEAGLPAPTPRPKVQTPEPSLPAPGLPAPTPRPKVQAPEPSLPSPGLPAPTPRPKVQAPEPGAPVLTSEPAELASFIVDPAAPEPAPGGHTPSTAPFDPLPTSEPIAGEPIAGEPIAAVEPVSSEEPMLTGEPLSAVEPIAPVAPRGVAPVRTPSAPREPLLPREPRLPRERRVPAAISRRPNTSEHKTPESIVPDPTAVASKPPASEVPFPAAAPSAEAADAPTSGKGPTFEVAASVLPAPKLAAAHLSATFALEDTPLTDAPDGVADGRAPEFKERTNATPPSPFEAVNPTRTFDPAPSIFDAVRPKESSPRQGISAFDGPLSNEIGPPVGEVGAEGGPTDDIGGDKLYAEAQPEPVPSILSEAGGPTDDIGAPWAKSENAGPTDDIAHAAVGGPTDDVPAVGGAFGGPTDDIAAGSAEPIEGEPIEPSVTLAHELGDASLDMPSPFERPPSSTSLPDHPLFEPPPADLEDASHPLLGAPNAEPLADEPLAPEPAPDAWQSLADALPPPLDPEPPIPPHTGDPEHPDTHLAAIVAGTMPLESDADSAVRSPDEPADDFKSVELEHLSPLQGESRPSDPLAPASIDPLDPAPSDPAWLGPPVPTHSVSQVPLLELTDDDPFDVALGQALNEELFDTPSEEPSPTQSPSRRPSSLTEADEELIDMASSSIDPEAFDDVDDDHGLVAQPEAGGAPGLPTAGLMPLWPAEADPDQASGLPGSAVAPKRDNELGDLSDELARIASELTRENDEPRAQVNSGDIAQLLGPITDEELSGIGENLTEEAAPSAEAPALDSLEMLEPLSVDPLRVDPLMPKSEAPSGLMDAEDVAMALEESAPLYAEPAPLLDTNAPGRFGSDVRAVVDPASLDLVDADEPRRDDASDARDESIAFDEAAAEDDAAELERQAEASAMLDYGFEDGEATLAQEDPHFMTALGGEAQSEAPAEPDAGMYAEPTASNGAGTVEFPDESPSLEEALLSATATAQDREPSDVAGKTALLDIRPDEAAEKAKAEALAALHDIPEVPNSEEDEGDIPTLLIRRQANERPDSEFPRTEPMPPLEPMDDADTMEALGSTGPIVSGKPQGSTRIRVTGVSADGAPVAPTPPPDKDAAPSVPKPAFRPAKEQHAVPEDTLLRPLPSSILPDPEPLSAEASENLPEILLPDTKSIDVLAPASNDGQSMDVAPTADMADAPADALSDRVVPPTLPKGIDVVAGTPESPQVVQSGVASLKPEAPPPMAPLAPPQAQPAPPVDAVRPQSDKSPATVAIDIGGRWTKLGQYESAEVTLIPAGGSPLVPSVVAVREDGSIATGTEARGIAVTHPDRAVSIRDVLRALDDPDIRADIAPSALKIIDEEVFLQLGDSTIPFREALFHFLALLRSGIVQRLGNDPFKVVLIVPQDLTAEGRRYLRAGCVEAKLEVGKLVTEADALAYAHRLNERGVEHALLVDLGATHLSLTVLHRSEDQLVIRAHRWLNKPCGRTIDEEIAQMTLDELARQVGADYRNDPVIRHRLTEASERARADVRRSSTFDLKAILPAPDSGETAEQTIRLARAQVYSQVEPLVAEMCRHAQEILREVGIDPRFTGAVVLAGSGASFSPVVEGLQSLTLQEPLQSLVPTQSFLIGGSQLALQMVRHAQAQRPDALAAAVGVELPGGRFRPLAPTGSGLPLRLHRSYPTTRDNQTDLELKFYQGEGDLVRSNVFVGSVALHGLPVGLRGELTIELDLHIDKEGVLTVSLSEPKSDALNTMRVPTRQTPEARRQSLLAEPAPPRRDASAQKPKKKGLLSRLFGRS